MRINGQETNAMEFAFEGCHKIYLLEDDQDKHEAIENGGYQILPIELLPATWENACELRFISNWKLDKRFVQQFEEAKFEL